MHLAKVSNSRFIVASLWRRAGAALVSSGFDPRATIRSLRFLPGYVADMWRWQRRASLDERRMFPLRILPTLADKYAESGVASGHYFHQDLWAARRIRALQPERHVDVGSRIDGFVAHLLSFREVEVVDIRPLESRVEGLRFVQADLMSPRPQALKPSPSVSCLHALEHFGLGRYGDPVVPEGWRLGLRNLAALVAPGGLLYLGVPIGRPAVEFNAQRIFAPRYVVDEAERHDLTLVDFAYVDDVGDFHSGEIAIHASLESSAELDYGCGLYVFAKGNPA
jgi:hypothetical protein